MLFNFKNCLAFTLHPQQDGQPFHTTPGDAGGTTAYGITRATYGRWLKRPATDADMRSITPTLAGAVYNAWYWQPISGDDLPTGIDLMVFDHGVVAGEHTAAMELQRVLDVAVDGHIGPITLKIARACVSLDAIDALRAEQVSYYRQCRDFARFGRGWLARVDRRAAAAKAMITTT